VQYTIRQDKYLYGQVKKSNAIVQICKTVRGSVAGGGGGGERLKGIRSLVFFRVSLINSRLSVPFDAAERYESFLTLYK
jgi:hypothetical protein